MTDRRLFHRVGAVLRALGLELLSVALLVAALLVFVASGAWGAPPGSGTASEGARTGAAVGDSAATSGTAAVSDSSRAVHPDTVSTPPATPMRLTFFPRPGEPGVEPPPRRIEFEDGRFTWGDEDRALFRSRAAYNRVQGIYVEAGLLRPLDRVDWLPAWHARLGYGFASDRGTYGLGFEQPVAPLHKATVGVDAWREVKPFFYGDEVIGNGENSASAFFLHRDYRDWFESEGGRAFVGLYPSPFLRLSLGVTSTEERSLGRETDWALFNQDDSFRRNPGIAEGDYRAFDLDAAYDSRPRRRDGRSGETRPRSTWGAVEHWYRVSWERAGAGLGGDLDQWRVMADLRTYFRLTGRQTLSSRILLGTGRGHSATPGDPGCDCRLPVQDRFVLGGLGTLRGHGYRSLAGDHVALANLQYAFSVSGRAQAVVFLDAGTAWDDGDLTDRFIPVDLGTGFRLGEDGVALLLARSVNRSDTGVKTYVRFQESF